MLLERVSIHFIQTICGWLAEGSRSVCFWLTWALCAYKVRWASAFLVRRCGIRLNWGPSLSRMFSIADNENVMGCLLVFFYYHYYSLGRRSGGNCICLSACWCFFWGGGLFSLPFYNPPLKNQEDFGSQRVASRAGEPASSPCFLI